MELNSLGEDIIKLLSPNGSGVSSSTLASSEYRLKATVCDFLYILDRFIYIHCYLKLNSCLIDALNIYHRF